ncbi:tyrosine-protein kinase family protein [Marinomonas mediterranea]|jgi:ATPases involved in chromosome partitioning|uniref:Putative capsular polysaccharide biosynthesis protein n=1 Tax=Marinomonas mediterranea (strain ATCC 700492 / JCM 21426 / NBRC 103028 / MMB-1) TaxID=717774 RepID=F2K2G6_MARM1|nr:tyrosine-protein kinase family protein [Marinomonas mediterranea]ADZ90011.1 putative capsular polysaccharide biosynthesis protein [Marinomonas mediterranea MMB-1]WCN08077.1 tyrosine-protein kinase family protein [Marinomonas mediterranea]WCN16219.1 tyrosine-protein kinase family protein [Marinomonas mediterranea MMB-1]
MNNLPVNYVELESIFTVLERKGSQVISLSGAHNQCGVSMTAYALAKRYQANGYSVLLVDLNLYHPSLNSTLGLPRSKWNIGDITEDAIIKPTESGTHYLPAPICSSAPLNFRDPGLVRNQMNDWLKSYDRIVIDTAPISGNNYRDIPTDLICSVSDASLLLIQTEVTTQTALRSSCDKLEKAKANLAGIIMNDVEFPSLANEMLREANRLNRFLPWLSSLFKKAIRRSTFLNLRV